MKPRGSSSCACSSACSSSSEGLTKLRWFLNSERLAKTLAEWLPGANAWRRAYLQHVAIPYVEIFSRLVVLGELCCGIALIAGLFTRPAAIAGFLMVLNFHFASSALFKYAFFTNGYGLPVLGGLLALAIGAGRLPWSVKGYVGAVRWLQPYPAMRCVVQGVDRMVELIKRTAKET